MGFGTVGGVVMNGRLRERLCGHGRGMTVRRSQNYFNPAHGGMTRWRRGYHAQRGITPCSGPQLLSTVLVCKIDQQYRLPIQRVHMLRFLNSLFGRVVLALIAGVAIGLLWPDTAVQLKPLGDGFIKLIKMLIPLIVFCVVVHGIAGTGDLKRVGRVGIKSLIYFEVVTTIALVLGLALAFWFEPGVGMNVDPKALDPKAMGAYADNASKLTGGGFSDFLLKLIPTTAVSAFANGDVLQVLLFSIVFGCALALMGERGARVTSLIEDLSPVLFKTMGLIIKLAPLGVLGAIAFTVGKYGIGSLKQLGMLVVLFYAAVAFFVVVVLGLIMRFSGFSLFNLLAFSIYITLAAVFIAQATNTPISMADLLTILAISLVTSKGAHGVPGSAIVVLAATLHAIPAIPAIGLVLVLSVDWFMGIARALGNLIGNCVATVAIAAWEGDIDRERAHAVLDGRSTPPLAPEVSPEMAPPVAPQSAA